MHKHMYLTDFLSSFRGLVTNLCNGIIHNLLVRHIALVAHKELVHTLCGIAIDLLKPLLDVIKGVHIGHIVDDADAVSATVV